MRPNKIFTCAPSSMIQSNVANKTATQHNNNWRTPIVTVMGHVDHGKTSLLDAIRGTDVAGGEAGGITQNTRAHQITTDSGRKITFIDTPGHEAFSAMRARGTEVTDFVLLVVAADDGIQPQTKESIKFAQEAKVPMIVAINKIDIQGVKTEKVKKELASFGVSIEEYGGDVLYFEVSATKEIGVKKLVEGIELLSEIHQLSQHSPSIELAEADAYVLESTNDKRLGSVALCVLKSASISNKGFGVTAGQIFKVRTFLDQFQKPIDNLNESDPFWVSGLKYPISTGEKIYFASDEPTAKLLQSAIAKAEEEASAEKEDPTNILMSMLMQKQAKELGVEQKVLNVVLRASTQGTLEVAIAELEKLGDDEKKIKVLQSATGDITPEDIRRAQIASGIVIGFQVGPSKQIQSLARQEKVILRNYEIIYEMVDEIAGALEGLIEPEDSEVEVARARVKQVFTLSDGSIVAGCMVIKGKMIRGYQVYVERPSQSTKDSIAEIGRGKIKSLRVQKSEVKEVNKDNECGIMIDPAVINIEEGDEVVAYKLE